MSNQPKVSIVVPIHDMKNGEFFLWRLVNSLTSQTFKDWELIITKDGKMAENTNAGIKRARGEFVKIMYLDDYFGMYESCLEQMSLLHNSNEWGFFGSENNKQPIWTDNVETGNNKLGSPSALFFRNHFEDNLLFDENMSWLLDCDLYKRMYQKYGAPLIIGGPWIGIGQGDHQMTHILTDEEKLSEYEYITRKIYE